MAGMKSQPRKAAHERRRLQMRYTLPMRKAFKYKLRVSRAVAEKLTATPNVCRELYNAALQERRDAYRQFEMVFSFRLQLTERNDGGIHFCEKGQNSRHARTRFARPGSD